MRANLKTAAIAAAVFFVAPSVYAVAAQWVINTSSTAAEKTFEGAADWFDENNWTNGLIASGSDVTAHFWTPGSNWDNSGIRYVAVDRDLTVTQILRWWNNTRTQSAIDANRRIVLAGDHTITLDGTSMRAYLAGVGIYGNIHITASSTYPLIRQVDICGPFVNDSGSTALFDAAKGLDALSRFRRDLWADGTSEGITNFAPTKLYLDGQTQIGFYAPEGSDGVSGTWKLTEGSAIAYRVGDAHALSAGTTVTGEGVPEGAYVKRIYSNAIFELSQAATISTGDEGTTLEFAAFHPKAYQRIDPHAAVSHSATYYDGFWPMKHTPEDEMTVEMFDLKPTSGIYNFYVDCEDGYLPGRFIFHNTSTFNRLLLLGTCEVEFAATTNNTAAGFPNLVAMRSGADGMDDIARVIVPDGVDASFGSLTNVVGTFVKAGAGTLTAPVVSNADFGAADSGEVVVEEGSLVLTCDSGDPIHMRTLAITNGATLTIPSCGIEAETVLAEAGAVVNGTGFFYAVETNDLSGISFGEGVAVIRRPVADRVVPSENFFWETNVTAGVVGNPALWLDASRIESFEMSDARSPVWGYAIRTWYDMRGEEYGYARIISESRPQYLLTNSLGQARLVFVGASSSTEPANREELDFNRRINGIRSVFKVISTHSGGSNFLGGGNLKRGANASTDSRTKPYTWPVFYNVSELYTNSLAFFVNGDRRDWRQGYPFGGHVTSTYSNDADLLVPVVVEAHFPDANTYAGNFGYVGKYDNGCDYIYECLIYTNELTEVERLAVRGYLMDKWQGASLNYEPESFGCREQMDVGIGCDYHINAGETAMVSDLSGPGPLTKYGAGALVVENARTTSLHVVGGTVSLRSLAVPTASGLPGNPYLHLDASDVDSLVVENGKVASWVDVRGEGHPVAAALNAGKGPAFEENALNDMPAVDFGAHVYGKISSYGASCPTLVYDAVSNAHTVIQVLDTSQGGGALLGWNMQGQTSITGGRTYGFYRNNRYYGGDWSKPIVYTNSYASGAGYYDLGRLSQPGGARVRLNGADVDAGVTGFTGGYDLVSVVTYKPMCAGAIAQLGIDSSNFTYGGQKVCELLIFTNVLSRAEVKAVEAYLSKKWFNRVLPEYEQAGAKDVAVDAGATMEIYGGAPLAVESLSGAGTVSGAVELADSGVLEIAVEDDGSLVLPEVTGGLSLLGGGTIRLAGFTNKLRAGRHVICSLSATAGGTWTAVADGYRGHVRVDASGDVLAIVVVPPGTRITIQ